MVYRISSWTVTASADHILPRYSEHTGHTWSTAETPVHLQTTYHSQNQVNKWYTGYTAELSLHLQTIYYPDIQNTQGIPDPQLKRQCICRLHITLIPNHPAMLIPEWMTLPLSSDNRIFIKELVTFKNYPTIIIIYKNITTFYRCLNLVTQGQLPARALRYHYDLTGSVN